MPAVHDAGDPARGLFTLSALTGSIVLVAGILRLGSMLRFVSDAVVVPALSLAFIGLANGCCGLDR